MARFAALMSLLVVVVACSNAVDTEALDADRTIVITMKDNHFEPDRIKVQDGESIAFRFINRGHNTHDAFFGDAKEQDEHERTSRMTDDAGHGEGHGTEETSAVTVEAGETTDLVHRFTEKGKTLIGCHEPGHYEGGMVVSVTVR